MFFIPGQLISAVTFIGVIVHEAAHQLFCRLMKVPVLEVKYFRFGNPAGYVLHEATDRPLANFLICIGPFLVNTLLGAVLILPASIDVFVFENYTNPLTLFSAYLGLSILMHAFPSSGDAASLTSSVIKNKKVNLLWRILAAPIVGLIYIGTVGSVVWLDLIYGVGIALLIPRLILLFGT